MSEERNSSSSISAMIQRFRTATPSSREQRKADRQQGKLKEMWWVSDANRDSRPSFDYPNLNKDVEALHGANVPRGSNEHDNVFQPPLPNPPIIKPTAPPTTVDDLMSREIREAESRLRRQFNIPQNTTKAVHSPVRRYRFQQPRTGVLGLSLPKLTFTGESDEEFSPKLVHGEYGAFPFGHHVTAKMVEDNLASTINHLASSFVAEQGAENSDGNEQTPPHMPSTLIEVGHCLDAQLYALQTMFQQQEAAELREKAEQSQAENVIRQQIRDELQEEKILASLDALASNVSPKHSRLSNIGRPTQKSARVSVTPISGHNAIESELHKLRDTLYGRMQELRELELDVGESDRATRRYREALRADGSVETKETILDEFDAEQEVASVLDNIVELLENDQNTTGRLYNMRNDPRRTIHSHGVHMPNIEETKDKLQATLDQLLLELKEKETIQLLLTKRSDGSDNRGEAHDHSINVNIAEEEIDQLLDEVPSGRNVQFLSNCIVDDYPLSRQQPMNVNRPQPRLPLQPLATRPSAPPLIPTQMQYKLHAQPLVYSQANATQKSSYLHSAGASNTQATAFSVSVTRPKDQETFWERRTRLNLLKAARVDATKAFGVSI